jgi:hypothetical protein
MSLFSKSENSAQMMSSKEGIVFVDCYDDYREVRLVVKKFEGGFSGDALGCFKMGDRARNSMTSGFVSIFRPSKPRCIWRIMRQARSTGSSLNDPVGKNCHSFSA